MERTAEEVEQDKRDEEARQEARDEEAIEAAQKIADRKELLENETDAEQRTRRLSEGVS